MTANHAHTPITPEYVKDPAHFRAVYVDHMDSGKYDGPTPNMSERTRGAYALQFDRMIQAVEAAAEQRGAIKALRHVASMIKLGNEYYEMLVEDELNDRADLLEGDDE